jgi:hypothetical protein
LTCLVGEKSLGLVLRLLLETRVIGPVPAGIAGAAELAQSERPQAGGGVILGAKIADDDVLDGLRRRSVSILFSFRCVSGVRPAHGGAS